MCMFCVYVHVGRWVCTWYRGQKMGIQFLPVTLPCCLFKTGSLTEPRVYWLARLTGQQSGNPHLLYDALLPAPMLGLHGVALSPPVRPFLCECWESKLTILHHSSFAEYQLPISPSPQLAMSPFRSMLRKTKIYWTGNRKAREPSVIVKC